MTYDGIAYNWHDSFSLKIEGVPCPVCINAESPMTRTWDSGAIREFCCDVCGERFRLVRCYDELLYIQPGLYWYELDIDEETIRELNKQRAKSEKARIQKILDRIR